MQKKGGRPRKFRNRKELEAAIETYFAKCDERCIPPTMPGLAMALGYTKVSSLKYLEKETAARSQFSAVLGFAKLRIEDFWESLLVGRDSTPGQVQLAMMVLQRSFGWRVPKEQEAADGEKSGGVKIKEMGMGMEEWQAMWRETGFRRSVGKEVQETTTPITQR